MFVYYSVCWFMKKIAHFCSVFCVLVDDLMYTIIKIFLYRIKKSSALAKKKKKKKKKATTCSKW
jgi:hypothetical protein